jgi:hypothetical protein
MVKFTFYCRDGVGVGATIIGYFARAGVNIRSIDLSVADKLIRTASGSIVVSDEDAEKAKKAIGLARERERQLSIRRVRTFYQLLIAIPNEIGALFREIGTLARHDVYFRRLHHVESALGEAGVIILLELEGPVEKYVEAKKLLKDRIVGEDSEFRGTILQSF